MTPDERLYSDILDARAVFIGALSKALSAGLEIDIDFEREDDDPPTFPIQVRRRIRLPKPPAESRVGVRAISEQGNPATDDPIPHPTTTSKSAPSGSEPSAEVKS